MKALVIFGLPAALSIFIFEFFSAQMFFFIKSDIPYSLEILRFIYIIPAIFFAYISDKNYRKEALLISHGLGLVACTFLYVYGLEFWTFCIFSLIFNPISVARAALLDNFPKSSPLKLMAFTFAIQNLTWIIFCIMVNQGLSPEQSIWILGTLLLFNAFLIFFFFKDNKDLFDKSHHIKHLEFLQSLDRRWIYILIAVTLANITTYLVWGRIEKVDEELLSWFCLINTSLLLGSLSALLYKKLPHLSIVTLAYVTGACMVLICIFEHSFDIFQHKRTFLSVMSHYFVLTGLYLPLVTDGIITIFGRHRKALGAVTIDFSQSFALIFAAMINPWMDLSFYYISFSVLGLLIVASIIQKICERKSVVDS